MVHFHINGDSSGQDQSSLFPLWSPPSNPGNKDLTICQFMSVLEREYHVKFDDYHSLHRWSVENYDKFWREIWHFCDIKYSKVYDEVVDTQKRIDEIPQWFTGALLNYAENVLKFPDDKKPAIYFSSESSNGDVSVISFGELRNEVRKYAAGLKALGVKAGDRIAGYMPNSPECVFAMLASASIGAVWSSTSPDFGTMGVLDRLSQVEPKILFSIEAVIYNTKTHDHVQKLTQVVTKLPSLEHVILVPHVFHRDDIDIGCIPKCIFVDDFLRNGTLPGGSSYPQLVFEQLPFNHPLFIMFSSGTTGLPKCMVHSAGGTLIKHLEEHIVQENLSSHDILLFYTTTGWMMWNWLVTALTTGCSIVLYDGSPFTPNFNVLFDLVDKIGITALGVGAKCYSAFENNGLVPMKTNRLKSLKMLLSTGSPLKPQSYHYIYNCIKKDVLVGSIAGGTDIIACFIGTSWLLPVYAGEIQAQLLGCHMQSYNEQGEPVLGQRGELVCLKPFPSMPIYFLNDPQGEKYRKAYFDKYPGVWAHGDYCLISKQTGGIVMLGRSDGTLNPGGVRFGSAEIYHIVEAFTEIFDSICVAQKISPDDERVILFVKMNDAIKFTKELSIKICSAIRQKLSPRHVPAAVLPVAEIPYTVSGKKVEVAVKRVIAGEPVLNQDSLANPDCLKFYENLPELSLS